MKEILVISRVGVKTTNYIDKVSSMMWGPSRGLSNFLKAGPSQLTTLICVQTVSLWYVFLRPICNYMQTFLYANLPRVTNVESSSHLTNDYCTTLITCFTSASWEEFWRINIDFPSNRTGFDAMDALILWHDHKGIVRLVLLKQWEGWSQMRGRSL